MAAILVAVLALGGGGLYFFLSKKAQREADDAFTMVMNALAGEDMWERGDISYSLLRDTLTVDNVIVRLPDGAPAVRMDLERTVIKGAPEKAEVERLIALESWTSQPAAKLFDSCVFSGVSFQGARGKQISRATIKELNLTGAGLSESGPDPNPYGVATFLSLESLRMEALDALLSSDDGEADIAIGEVALSSYELAAGEIAGGDLWTLVEAVRIGSYDLKDLAINFNGVDGEELRLALAKQSFTGIEGLKYGGISYSGLSVMARSFKANDFFIASLAQASISQLDLNPIADKIKAVSENGFYHGDLASLQTVGSVLTGTIAYEAVSLNDFSMSYDGELSLKIESALNTGPFKPGTLPPKSVSKITGLSFKVDPNGRSEELEELRSLARELRLDELELSHELTCDYESLTGAFECRGTPLAGLEGLFEHKLSFKLTGLTQALLDQLSDIPVDDIGDIRFLPRASALNLESLKIEIANLGLVDKLYSLGAANGLDKGEIRGEALAYVEVLIPALAPFDQTDRLQEELHLFVDDPQSLAISFNPNKPLLDYVYKNASLESINALGLGISVNNRPYIPLTLGLGPSAPKTYTPADLDGKQAEAARQEATKKEAAKQDAAKKEAAKKEAAKKEAAKKEAAKQDAAKQDAAKREADAQEAARDEAARQDAAKQEAARHDAARQDAARQDAARQEAARQEAARQDAAKQEAARQEAAKQEAARQEATRQETAGQSSSRRLVGQIPVDKTEQEAILSLVLDKLFQPGMWSAGETTLDPATGIFEVKDIEAQLPGDLMGPLSISKASWQGAADHESLWRVLFANDWSNQPRTALFKNFRLEGLRVPVKESLDSEGELRIGAVAVSSAEMTAGRANTPKTTMGFWSHLVVGDIDIDNLAAELVPDPAASDAIALSLGNLGATNLAIGQNQALPLGPFEDTLAFLKGLAAEEGRLSGLDFSATSQNGSLALKIGALSLNGLKNLATTHKSFDEVRYELERGGRKKERVLASVTRLDLAGIDPSELLGRLEPDYRNFIAKEVPPFYALFACMSKLPRYSRFFDALSPPVALDSLDLENAKLETSGLVFTLARAEATGPWRPGTIPAAQRVEFSGSMEIPQGQGLSDPASVASPESMEAILGAKSIAFSGRWRGVLDQNSNTLNWTLEPLISSDGQASIMAELAIAGVTKELVGFLYQIPPAEPERALFVPGFDALAVNEIKISLENPEIIKRFMAVAGTDPDVQAATANRLAKTMVTVLGPNAPGQALLVADLGEFLVKPERLVMSAKPRTPLPISALVSGAIDWRKILDALDSTVTVNQRTPLVVKTRPASN